MPRRPALEYIDDPNTSLEEIRGTLRDQAWVNRWVGGGEGSWRHALPRIREIDREPISIIELACGGADISRRIVEEARKAGREIRAVVADRNPRVLACAREWCDGYPEITLACADVTCPPFPTAAFDLVLLPTVLHHLSPGEAVIVLREAARICRGLVIAVDVRRSALACWGFSILARLARLTPVSRHDGRCSLQQAYTPRELGELANQAGITGWYIYRHRFFHMALVYPGQRLAVTESD
ncbi:MAG: methyltransferase domain-containing protein [Armatimonadota bacterium]